MNQQVFKGKKKAAESGHKLLKKKADALKVRCVGYKIKPLLELFPIHVMREDWIQCKDMECMLGWSTGCEDWSIDPFMLFYAHTYIICTSLLDMSFFISF